jgi:hypothetical protein
MIQPIDKSFWETIVKVEEPVFHQKWQFESNFVKVKNK